MNKQEKARLRIAFKRQDPAYRERENAIRRLGRIKKEFNTDIETSVVLGTEDVETEADSMLQQSENSEIYNVETLGDKLTGRPTCTAIQSNKELSKRLKARERMAKKRCDPEYVMKERARAREAKAKRRKDPAFLEFERAKNRQMMALKRRDPEYASRERERAREIMAQKRKNEDFARLERAMNRQRLALKRKDPDYKGNRKESSVVHEVSLCPPSFPMT